MTVRFTAEKAINAPKLTIDARKSRSIHIAASETTDTTRIENVGVAKRTETCPKTLRGMMPSRPMA